MNVLDSVDMDTIENFQIEITKYNDTLLKKPLIVSVYITGGLWVSECEDLSLAGFGMTFEKCIEDLVEKFAIVIEIYILDTSPMTAKASEYASKVMSYLSEKPVHKIPYEYLGIWGKMKRKLFNK